MVLTGSTGTVLDVGCADRWVEKELPPDCTYVGLDYPATGKHLYQAIPDCFADAKELPFGEGTVNTVLMLDVLEHLPDPVRALAEANRVLASGGSIVVSVPFLYPVHDAPYDFHRFTTFGLMHAMTRCGFLTTRVEPYSRAAEVAGLVCALWVGGVTLQCWKQRKPALLLMLPMLLLIPAINIAAWVAARLLPDWPATYGGVNIIARKGS